MFVMSYTTILKGDNIEKEIIFSVENNFSQSFKKKWLFRLFDTVHVSERADEAPHLFSKLYFDYIYFIFCREVGSNGLKNLQNKNIIFEKYSAKLSINKRFGGGLCVIISLFDINGNLIDGKFYTRKFNIEPLDTPNTIHTKRLESMGRADEDKQMTLIDNLPVLTDEMDIVLQTLEIPNTISREESFIDTLYKLSHPPPPYDV
jgi:hypothetical protein